MAAIQQPFSDRERQQLVASATDASPTKEGSENVHPDSAAKAPDSAAKAPDSSEVSIHGRDTHTAWTPFYLQPATLIGFVVVYLVLLLALVILAVADAKRNGIATAKSSEHYLWTYGPTAVLAVLAALWGQVEYRTKQAMPWKVLQQQPTPASKTLLLDYITPSLLEGFVNSLRSSHWPVAIAISNSLLIKLLTVASTGLLVLQKTTTVVPSCQLTVADDFASSFNTSAIGSTPVLSTLAIQNGSISYPPGTSRDTAFQKLEAPIGLGNLADVEVEGLSHSFHAGLNCDTATVTSHGSACSDLQCRGMNISLAMDSPTCQVQEYNYTKSCGFSGPGSIQCDFQDAWAVQCDSVPDGHDPNRLLFISGRLNEHFAGLLPDLVLNVLSNETTAILCEPNYNITSTRVRMDQSGNIKKVLIDPAHQNNSQPFLPWDLVDGLYTSVKAAGLLLGISYSKTGWSSDPWAEFWYFFKSWVDVAHPSSNLSDVEVLKSTADELFSMVTAQMASQNLRVTSADNRVGTCYTTDDRLRVRGLSLYMMAATLIFSAVSTVLLVYVGPQSFTTRDPATIGGLALILSRSPAMLSQLSKQGLSNLKDTKNHLQGLQCQSAYSADSKGSGFLIQLTSEKEVPDAGAVSKTITPSSTTTFWRPLSLQPIFKFFVIAFLLILIVALEVVFSISERHGGLAEVDPQGYVRFSWAYVPATIMLTAQVLVGMVAFSSLLIFPYSILRSRTSNTRNDILRDYISQPALQSAWKAAANKHFPAFFVTLAMLLTPLLTIAVSGLYTAQPVETKTNVTLSVVNQLNTSNMTVELWDTAKSSEASTSMGLLLTQNFSYPLQTFNELVFPGTKLNLPETMNSSTNALAGSNITTILPAIRGELSCTSGQGNPKNFSHMLFYNDPEIPQPFVDAGCTPSLWVSPGSSAFGFFTKGSEDSKFGTSYCGAYGTNETNWRAVLCSSILTQLDVNVTLDASTLAVQAATPDESTQRLFANRTLTTGAELYPSSVIPSIFGQADFGGATLAYSFYDPTFQAVIYGAGTTTDPYSFPIAQYMDDDGFSRIEALLTHVYRTVVAQSANLMIRVPYNGSAPLAPPASVDAVLTNPHVYRLRQSAVSTRILDGLLAAIAVCVALAFWLMDTRDVLPNNPASIAAGASLLAADAEMFKPENLPEGAQWCGDAELEERGVWSGCVFSLGWWGMKDADGEAKRFGLDMGKAES